jgi:MipA family protein
MTGLSKRAAALAVLALTAGATASEAKDWTVSVGARAKTAPPYEGSDNYVVRPAFSFSVRSADRPYRFTPPDAGISFSLIDNDRFELGPMVRFRSKRKNTGVLTGLDKVKWAAEPGGFVDVWPASWLRLHGEARHGFGGHSGLVGDVGVDLVHRGTKWDLSVGGRTGWGDGEYLREYFGVSAVEAARSPLIGAAYDPGGGGRRYTGAVVSGAYHFSKRVRINGDLGYRRLADRAGNSPIVSISGSRDQYSGSIGATYSFDIGL